MATRLLLGLLMRKPSTKEIMVVLVVPIGTGDSFPTPPRRNRSIVFPFITRMAAVVHTTVKFGL